MAHRGAALDRGRSLPSTVALCDLCDALVSAAGTGGCAHRGAALGRSLPSTAALCDAGGFSRWHRWTCERCQ